MLSDDVKEAGFEEADDRDIGDLEGTVIPGGPPEHHEMIPTETEEIKRVSNSGRQRQKMFAHWPPSGESSKAVDHEMQEALLKDYHSSVEFSLHQILRKESISFEAGNNVDLNELNSETEVEDENPHPQRSLSVAEPQYAWIVLENTTVQIGFPSITIGVERCWSAPRMFVCPGSHTAVLNLGHGSEVCLMVDNINSNKVDCGLSGFHSQRKCCVPFLGCGQIETEHSLIPQERSILRFMTFQKGDNLVVNVVKVGGSALKVIAQFDLHLMMAAESWRENIRLHGDYQYHSGSESMLILQPKMINK